MRTPVYTNHIHDVNRNQRVRWSLHYAVFSISLPEKLAQEPAAAEIQFLPAARRKQEIKQILNSAPEHLTELIRNLPHAKTELPPFWATQEGIKAQLKQKKETGESKVTLYPTTNSTAASKSRQIYTRWGHIRSFVRAILQSLADNQKLTTAFENLIGATRFKTPQSGVLMCTQRPRRQQPNLWGPLQLETKRKPRYTPLSNTSN